MLPISKRTIPANNRFSLVHDRPANLLISLVEHAPENLVKPGIDSDKLNPAPIRGANLQLFARIEW